MGYSPPPTQSCFVSCPVQTGLGKLISISSALGRRECIYLLSDVLPSFGVNGGVASADFEQLLGRCLRHWDDGVVIEET